MTANVLVTSAGRRTALVRAFAEATRARGIRTFASDVDGLAPALYEADAPLHTLPTAHPEFVDHLSDQVARHGIGLIVPTIDPELGVLSEARDRLERAGARIALSNASFLEIARDKATTAATFAASGVDVPRTWTPPIDSVGRLPDDLFVKPRFGSGSEGAQRVAQRDLARVLESMPDAVVQEFVAGREVTIDALLDFAGRPIHYVPRLRLKTVGGESVQGVTLAHDDAIESWIERVLDVASRLGARGPLTLQGFLTPAGPVLTEVNARFGGGFPLGLAAGAQYPSWLLDMIAGHEVAARLGEYQPGLYMTRAHVEQFVLRPLW